MYGRPAPRCHVARTPTFTSLPTLDRDAAELLGDEGPSSTRPSKPGTLAASVDDAGVRVDVAGRADSDAVEVAAACLRQRRADRADDRVDDVACLAGLRRLARALPATCSVAEHDRLDLRPAEIDAGDHASFGGRPFLIHSVCVAGSAAIPAA